MGSKKKKNSNYVTEKTIKAKLEADRAEKKKKSTRLALIITAITLCVAGLAAMIVGIVIAVGNSNSQKFTATHHASITVKDYGTIHVELYGEEAPITVANFVELAGSGFYDGLKFHRIIDGFMAQGGKSAVSRDTIVGEFEANGYENNILHQRGVISMARANDYDSASTEFFIVQDTEGAEHLDGDYAAFGKVTDGMDIIDKICENAKPYDNNGSILPADQPVITSITIHAAHSH